MEDSINERFKIVLDYYKYTPETFAEKINISGMAVRNVLKKKNNPSYEMILGLLNLFPLISADWLLKGGNIKEMFSAGQIDFIKEKFNEVEREKNELQKRLEQESRNLLVAHKLIDTLEDKLR